MHDEDTERQQVDYLMVGIMEGLNDAVNELKADGHIISIGVVLSSIILAVDHIMCTQAEDFDQETARLAFCKTVLRKTNSEIMTRQ